MNTRKTIGIILMVLLLILCAVLMVLRFSAAKASDAAALRESMATPVPTATVRFVGIYGDAGADRYARADAGPGLPCRPRRGARSARAAGHRYQQLGVYPRKRR